MGTFMSNDFATHLIYLRGEKNITQQELGDAAGVSPSQISRYEAGQAMPRKTVLRKLAGALGVTVEELQGIQENQSHELNFGLSVQDLDDLQSIADKSGKSLEEVVSETLRWGLKRFKEDPEFAATIKRGIEERRDNQDEQ